MTTSCAACSQEVIVDRNRDRDIKVTLQINGGVFDISGFKVWFSVKSELDDPDSDALIFKRNAAAGGDDSQIKITDGPNGVLYVYIKPADTANMQAGDYWWDVVIETLVPKKLQAVLPSTFKVRETVTVAS